MTGLQWLPIVQYSSSVIAFLLFLSTWKHRKQPGGLFLALMFVSITIWTLMQGTEYILLSQSAKIWCSKFSYIGILTVALFFFESIHCYLRKTIVCPFLPQIILGIFPLVIFGFVLTNGIYHSLLWVNVTPISSVPGSLLLYQHGILTYFIMVYSYLLLSSSLIQLIDHTIKSEPLLRFRYLILIFAALFPLLGNILYIGDYLPLKGVDFTSFGFIISSMLLYVVIFRYRFFGVKPIVNEVLFQHEEGFVVLLDSEMRILMINNALQLELKLPYFYIGKLLPPFLRGHPALEKAFQSKEPTLLFPDHVFYSLDGNTRKQKTVYYEMTKKELPIGDNMLGTLFRVADVTNKITQRQDLLRKNQLQETLIEIGRILLSDDTDMSALREVLIPIQQSFEAELVSIVQYYKKPVNDLFWKTFAHISSLSFSSNPSQEQQQDTFLQDLCDLSKMGRIFRELRNGKPVSVETSWLSDPVDSRMSFFLKENHVVLIPILMRSKTPPSFSDEAVVHESPIKPYRQELWGYIEVQRKNTPFTPQNGFTDTELRIMPVLVTLLTEYMIRKKIQSDLLASKERFEQVANQAREIIWEIDENLEITYLSNSFLEIFSMAERKTLLTKEEFLRVFVGQDSNDSSTSQIEKFREIFFSQKAFRDFPFHSFDIKGKMLYFLINAIPIFNAEGEFKGFHGSAFDITLIRELEIMKDSFVNTVSHEFRTPLFAIRESINIVKKESLGEINSMQKNALDISLRNTDRLVRLINDILDYQRYQSGRFEVNPESVPVRSVIEEAFFSIRSLVDQKGLLLKKAIAPDCPNLFVDKDKIVQVLINLLSNGLKFTTTGTLMVKVYPDYSIFPELLYREKNEEAPGMLFAEISVPGSSVFENQFPHQGYIHFEVEDTGIGIKPDDLSKLFHTFSQITSKDQPKSNGTGLGLVISKQIVTLHHGKIWAESVWEKGTTFHVLLPMELSSNAK